jgi:hypothetical protein
MGMKLSGRGRRALKDGLDGMHPEDILLMEILARVKSIDEDNLDKLAEELVAEYGSPENAIEAIKCRKAWFELRQWFQLRKETWAKLRNASWLSDA